MGEIETLVHREPKVNHAPAELVINCGVTGLYQVTVPRMASITAAVTSAVRALPPRSGL